MSTLASRRFRAVSSGAIIAFWVDVRILAEPSNEGSVLRFGSRSIEEAVQHPDRLFMYLDAGDHEIFRFRISYFGGSIAGGF